MEIIKNTVKIGLEEPVKLLHVTDTHMPMVDGTDDERKLALYNRRVPYAGTPEQVDAVLKEQTAYAEENCDLLVHTGDLIDFTSRKAVEWAREYLKNEKVFFAVGNHEFTRYMGEAWEDEAYKMNSYMEMGYGFGVDIFFNSRVVKGVNLVAIDNSYYRFAVWQLERLKAEVKKGLPVVLAFHTPLYEKSLLEYHMSLPGADCAYLAGVGEDDLKRYSEIRAMQQRPDEITMKVIDYIKSEPLIKCILAGHLHFNFESFVTPDLPQFVTDVGFKNICREITLI